MLKVQRSVATKKSWNGFFNAKTLLNQGRLKVGVLRIGLHPGTIVAPVQNQKAKGLLCLRIGLFLGTVHLLITSVTSSYYIRNHHKISLGSNKSLEAHDHPPPLQFLYSNQNLHSTLV